MTDTLHYQNFISPVKKEHKLDIHSCSQCSYQTKSSFAIARHIKRNHLATSFSTPFDCSSSTPEPYTCQGCSFESNLAVNFNQHVDSQDLIDITKIYKMYVCRNCNFTTFSRLVFMKHAYDKCENRRVGSGPNCQRLNVYNDKHSDFVKCHRFLKCIPYTDIRWLKCQHCSYQTKMKGNLKKHMGPYHMMPESVKWFECEQCLFNVKQIFFLREHLLTEHPEDIMF